MVKVLMVVLRLTNGEDTPHNISSKDFFYQILLVNNHVIINAKNYWSQPHNELNPSSGNDM